MVQLKYISFTMATNETEIWLDKKLQFIQREKLRTRINDDNGILCNIFFKYSFKHDYLAQFPKWGIRPLGVV